jgi:hypothetical protein
MAGTGTWIDWQYLLDAAALLARCRYTLQNTYPFAYFLAPGPRKDLVSIVIRWRVMVELWVCSPYSIVHVAVSPMNVSHTLVA